MWFGSDLRKCSFEFSLKWYFNIWWSFCSTRLTRVVHIKKRINPLIPAKCHFWRSAGSKIYLKLPCDSLEEILIILDWSRVLINLRNSGISQSTVNSNESNRSEMDWGLFTISAPEVRMNQLPIKVQGHSIPHNMNSHWR